MYKLTKDEDVKVITNKKNLKLLLEKGWKLDGDKSDLDELKEEARELGVTFSVNIGEKTLKNRIEDAKAEKVEE